MLDHTAEPWPPTDYAEELNARIRRLSDLRRHPERWAGAKEFYRLRPHSFIRHWGVTYDPRLADGETPVLLPFVPFKRQRELTSFVYACLRAKQGGLIEKSRDMGATWDCSLISVHLFLFWEVAIGWGSRKSELVDKIGDPKSIFEKIRTQLRHTPEELLPEGFRWDEHVNHMRIINPETGSSITGEGGDNVGRGGRTTIYFVDEAAHLERPELIEASLNSNTDVRIDISSVGAPGNVFHRRRDAGVEWDPAVGIVKGRTNVFVMDWRHHPRKTQDWYDEGRARHEDEGLLHVWAQEVDRDYAASIQGTIIPAAWARAAIDAHVKLELKGDGRWGGALDIADAGQDTNALALRQGIVLRALQEWGERDTGRTARRAVAACEGLGSMQLQYDAVGVGSGVKAEYNRLRDDKLMPRGLRFVPWNGGAGPMWPKRRVIEADKDSPLNEDFYKNLKAQGWWQLRRRFELTFKAVRLVDAGRKLTTEQHTALEYARIAALAQGEPVFVWDEDDLISLPSGIPHVWKLVKELSQPVAVKDTRLKLLVDKTPDGMKSPNLADSLMMAYWPVQAGGFDISDELVARSREPKPLPPPEFTQKRNHPPAQTDPGRYPPDAPQPPAHEQIVSVGPAHLKAPPPRRNTETQLRSTRPPVAPVQRIDD